jgi:BNR repeat-like domain/SPRY domain
MGIDTSSFRGMAPRLTPRALPANAAQLAINAKLVTGDLEAWRQFALVETLAHSPETIYLLDDTWLSWLGDVDVARSLIPGDISFTVYLTGEEYANPRWTNYSLATSSPGGPAPVITRPLGVPNPDTVPVVTVVPATIGTPDIDVTDEGGELTSWVTSPPVNAGVGGGFSAVSEVNSSASPSLYRLNTDAGNGGNFRLAYMYRDFGVNPSSAIVYEADFRMTRASDANVRQMIAHVANPVDGNGIVVWYDNVVAEGKLNLGANGGGWGNLGGVGAAITTLASVDVGALTGPTVQAGLSVLNPDTGWYHLEVTVSALSDDEQTVTASLYDGYQGTTLLGTVSATSRFGLGGYCGQSFAHSFDSNVASTWVDWANIHVTGSGERGLAILDVPVNYLFTYVNAEGQEGGIFEPSSTVTRPDGASVSVVTTTEVPRYIADDYDIATKRIYRAVVGNAGAAFLFVAEIPLAQEEYIDTIPDALLGDPIESLLYALPPDNLRGIISLPNGIMAGFFDNQLCFSARNAPHAWPVEYRLTTDTAIVGIKNLDTTVVVGTESFPYLAEGVDPAAYSMRKLDDVPQACVSKRGMAVLSSGVVMPSPDGYIVIAQTGQARNLTETIFTRKQWQELAPETILAIVHDDVLHFWYDTDGAGGGEPALPLPDALVMVRANITVANTSRYLAWPVSTRLADNRILVAYTDAQSHHGSNDGTAVGIFSSDDGVTWGSQFTIHDEASLFVSAYGVSQISSGRIFVVLWRDTFNVSPSGEAGLVYSDDNGVSWSAWLDLDAPSGFTQESFGAGPVVELPNGDLLVTVEGSFTGQAVAERGSRLLRSTDGGLTWGSPVDIAAYATYARAHYESKLVVLGGDNLLCLHRSTNGPGDIYTNFSSNGGVTWTVPTLAFPGYGAPNTVKLADGVLVSVLRRNADAAASVYMSYDSGATWVEEALVDTTPFEMEYGSAVELPDDEVLVFYSSQPTSSTTNADLKRAVLRQVFDIVGFSLTGGTATTQNSGATMYTASGLGAARTAQGRSTGHYYCEFLIQAGEGNMTLGVVGASAALTTYPGGNANGWAYYGLNGQKYTNNVGSAYGATFTFGDVIGLEYNNGTLTFYKNGVSQGAAFSGVTGEVFPAAGPGTSGALLRGTSLNLGYWPFVYSVPVGAVAWNTGV